MKQSRLVLVLVVALVAVTALVVASAFASQRKAQEVTRTAITSGEVVAHFRKEAQKAGFVVQEGMPLISNLNDLYLEYKMWAPLYPNPNSPYISLVLPKVPGQADPVASDGSFRLREDEALVVIGVTPPQMAYFSFNVHMLRGSLNNEIGPPILWIPVADPVSSLTMRTTGSTPFDRPFAVVAAGNRQTKARVHRLLRAVGLGAMTNDQVISPSLFQLGLGEHSDEFIFAMRTAVPADREAFDSYLDALRREVWVLRVRPKTASGGDQLAPVLAADPLPVPPPRVSGTGTTELDLNPTLQILRQRIIDRYPGYAATDLRVDPWFEAPYPGLQRDMVSVLPAQDGVAGASTDCTYLASGNVEVPQGAFLVAYGADHRATGKATYSSVAVYADAALGFGLVTVQSPDLQGSAHDYIDDQPDADRFYAWTFTRAASSADHVTTLPNGPFARPVDLDTLRVGYRAYAEPATRTHPSTDELLLDRLLMFTPKE